MCTGQSYMAFEVASRLCRQGTLAVLHVNEAANSSLQLPLISTDFILQGLSRNLSPGTEAIRVRSSTDILAN